MAGRPRKPTALKTAEGNRGHRPLNAFEPQPTLGVPRAPKGLPPMALALWRVLAAELDRLNVLTIVDGTALEGACMAVAQARAADERLYELLRLINSGKA